MPRAVERPSPPPFDRANLEPEAVPRISISPNEGSQVRAGLVRLVAALLVLPIVGCGYALVGKGSNLPPDIESIYVVAFENRTTRAQVEQLITQAITSEFVTRQRYRLADSADEADAVLEGAITRFATVPLTFDGQGRAEEYELNITASVVFRRAGERADPDSGILWSNDRYLFKEVYDLSGDESTFFDRENIAMEEAAEEFAKTMVSDLLEGF
jgi:outer membrane lipopolysaccharide assembly protein LptE/RlpB